MGIKILCLNVLRTFGKKKLQLIAISMMIFLSSFLYSTMFYTLGSLTRATEDIMEVGNQEDFSIEMINAIMPSEIAYLLQQGKEEYITYTLANLKKVDYKLYQTLLIKRQKAFNKIYPNYDLEIREYKEINFDDMGKGHTLRIYKDAERINKSCIEEGKAPKRNNEIALTRVYAEKNNLNIGDTLKMKGKSYRFTGYVIFPDMTLPILHGGFIIDTSKAATALLADRAYESLQGKEYMYFAGKGKNGEELKGFKEEVIDDLTHHDSLEFITTIIETKNQMRSGMIYEELKMGRAMTLGLSMIISSITVMIVAILMAKLLRNEKVQIGVLKAMGYSSVEVALPYIWLLIILSLPTLIVGYWAGLVTASPMKNMYLEFYLLPNYDIGQESSGLIVAILIPLIMIVGLSFLIIVKLLSKEAMHLIKVGEVEKVTKLNKIITRLLTKAKVQVRYKYSFIFKNMGKFIVFFWGISFSSILILMSLMMINFFDKMSIEMYTSTGYNYEGHLDPTKSKPKVTKEQEKFLDVNNAFYEGENISIKGLSPTNKLYELYNTKEKNITELLSNGIIINRSFQITYDIDIGDILEVEINNKTYSRTVTGISKSYGDAMIFWEMEDLSKIVTDQKSKKLYTGVYSLSELNEERYAVVVSKNDIIEQAQSMQVFIQIAIYSMIGSAAFISILILYVITTLTVEDNYYNISLLKVMGYNKKEINNMILNSYLVYAVATYIIITPVVVLGIRWMVKYFSKAFNIVMPLEYELWHSVLGLIVIMSIFLIGSYGARRRIEKIALQEILKAYRE